MPLRPGLGGQKGKCETSILGALKGCACTWGLRMGSVRPGWLGVPLLQKPRWQEDKVLFLLWLQLSQLCFSAPHLSNWQEASGKGGLGNVSCIPKPLVGLQLRENRKQPAYSRFETAGDTVKGTVQKMLARLAGCCCPARLESWVVNESWMRSSPLVCPEWVTAVEVSVLRNEPL